MKEELSEKDKDFFQQLDKHSGELRKCSAEISVFLTKIKNQTGDLNTLIEPLEKISSVKIEEMDVAINELKKAFLLLQIKLDEKTSAIPSISEENLIILLEKYNDLFIKATQLTEKAFELKDS